MSDYAIEIRNYNLSIKTASSEISLLTDITTKINAGQVTAITGPSGAGKSLLSTAMMQLFYGEANFMQSGEILLCGQHVFGNGAPRHEQWRGRRITMIFQNPSSAFNPVKKCTDQILEAWQVCHPNRIAESTDQLHYWLKKLDLFEIPHIIEAYPHQLSGGQLQRLMFIMAVINKPDCIIADEPTTALDIWHTAEQLQLWKSICLEHHITLILVTHDLSLVKHLADQILFLKDGKLLFQAHKEVFFNNCQNPIVSKFIEDYFYFEKTLWNKSEKKSKTANSVLRADRICKMFRDNSSWLKSKFTNILSEITFTLEEGSILGITGASGSGKTTLLMSILKLTNINAGKLFWKSLDVTELYERELRSERKKFQIVFQDAYKSMPYFMTVRQVMLEACRAAGIAKYDEIIFAFPTNKSIIGR